MPTIDLQTIRAAHGAFLCPTVLFGSTSETRKKWRQVVKRAWADRDWRSASDMEMRDIRESATGIILRNDTGHKWSTEKQRWLFGWLMATHPLTGMAELWHLNWPVEVQPLSLEDQRGLHEEHVRFVICSMDLPWYAMGMFGFHSLYTANIFRPTEEREHMLVIVRKMVTSLHWLLTIHERLHRCSGQGMMVPYQHSAVLASLLSMLLWAGLVGEEQVQRLLHLDISQALESLVDLGIMRFDGTTFEACF